MITRVFGAASLGFQSSICSCQRMVLLRKKSVNASEVRELGPTLLRTRLFWRSLRYALHSLSDSEGAKGVDGML